MKKWLLTIRILTAGMIAPLFLTFLAASWNVHHTTKSQFTEEQLQELCGLLDIELLPSEKITTSYFPGVLQAPTSLSVSIEGIESEEAFLLRVQSKITSENTTLNELYHYRTSSYNIQVFVFEDSVPYDYGSRLSFYKYEDELVATFHFSGDIPQLKNVYGFLYRPLQPFLTYWPFMLCCILEFVLITFLIIHDLTYLFRAKKGA